LSETGGGLSENEARNAEIGAGIVGIGKGMSDRESEFRPRWARLRFGGSFKRWHLVAGLWSICRTQYFDYPRVERCDAGVTPEKGKLCKRCIAKAADASMALDGKQAKND
jgi:hypothetical protein